MGQVSQNAKAITIRPYTPADYPRLRQLYQQPSQYDPDRDSAQRLSRRITADTHAIIVAEVAGELVGSVSLIEDGRVAWLFRFVVEHSNSESAITKQLCEYAFSILRHKGHSQVLVYTPAGNQHLDERYEKLGFQRGHDYTCYWKEC